VILLDTTVFIDLFRNFKPAVDFFSGLTDYTEVVFSAVSEAELIAGKYCDNPDYREKTLHFLANFTKIPVDNKIAIMAGDVKRKYGVDLPDAIIAASALVTNSTILTSNVKDFDKIKDVKVKKPF